MRDARLIAADRRRQICSLWLQPEERLRFPARDSGRQKKIFSFDRLRGLKQSPGVFLRLKPEATDLLPPTGYNGFAMPVQPQPRSQRAQKGRRQRRLFLECGGRSRRFCMIVPRSNIQSGSCGCRTPNGIRTLL
jgi:hypothetical protein